jgi:hypothetical protein
MDIHLRKDTRYNRDMDIHLRKDTRHNRDIHNRDMLRKEVDLLNLRQHLTYPSVRPN